MPKKKRANCPPDLINSIEATAKSMTLDGLGINAPGILNSSIVEDQEKIPYGKPFVYMSYYFVIFFPYCALGRLLAAPSQIYIYDKLFYDSL